MRKRMCADGCGKEAAPGEYWCRECNEKRIERITKSIEEIRDSFNQQEGGRE